MRWLKLSIGPALGLLVLWLLQRNGVEAPAARMAFVLVWVATWWITEVIDLGATSLLPLVLMPALGIMGMDDTAREYMDQTIFLFIGGFLLAFGMEKWNLHRRLAFRIILLIGNKPSSILAGIMITTYLITMWISNTATTIMLISAVMAIIANESLFQPKSYKRIAVAYLLALAYTASIGGTSTLVGTPPNMIFVGFFEKMYPTEPSISFARWFAFAFPFSITFLVCAYLLLRFYVIGKKHDVPFDMQHIRDEYKSLGKVTREELTVMVVFFTTVILWFTRADIDFGAFKMKGWNNLFTDKSLIKDSTVAILAGLTLFILPSKRNKGEAILKWQDTLKLPFHIILLFGAGFAIAQGFETSGMAKVFASNLTIIENFPPWLMVMCIAIFVTILSEFASNIASVQLILPILVPLSVALNVNPMFLMVPATIAASFGYMMPVATAANTIVYGTGYIPVKSMMRIGLLFNIMGILLLTLFAYLLNF